MALLINTHFHLAIDSLRKNRGRTFLSALGIAIGVASIVLILSLTGGINSLISANTDKNNANLILVRPSNNKDVTENIIDELTANSQYTKSNLTLDDIKTLKDIKDVSAVAPIAITNTAVSVGNRTYQGVDVVATSSDLHQIVSLPLKSGQFLGGDLQDNVAVVGYDLATQLFGTTDAIAKTFSYQGKKFIVVGVLNKIDDPINFNSVDFDRAILINASYANTFETSIQIQQIDVRTANVDSVNDTVSAIKDKLTSSKNGDNSFQIISGNDSNLQPAGSLLSIISSMLTVVASISLIVGGVGIMNIMLVSVSERTREIGIRKAVGASSGNILLQFLFESIILSVIGGLMGFALGYLCAFLISLITPFTPHISWQILIVTGLTSLITGIIFGVYPAAKAASKDPITSLKYYR